MLLSLVTFALCLAGWVNNTLMNDKSKDLWQAIASAAENGGNQFKIVQQPIISAVTSLENDPKVGDRILWRDNLEAN